MGPKQLLAEGRLEDAIRSLTELLRSHPEDSASRTFLFELLCFAGNWERALKQLDILAPSTPTGQMGVQFYRNTILAEQTRQSMFEEGSYPGPAKEEDAEISGAWNGKPFEFLSDADARIGARLEVFAGDGYLWVPFRQIVSIEIQPPRRLRDLLWAPAILRTTGAFPDGRDLGEVLLPVLTPLSSRHADELVRLGRTTVIEDGPDGARIPRGQKVLFAGEDMVPLLELRRLEIQPAAEAAC